MTVRVIPLKSIHELRFDLVLEDFATVTLSIPLSELKGNERVTESIRKKVLDYLSEFGYSTDDLHIIYC